MKLNRNKKIKLIVLYALVILWIIFACIGYAKNESKSMLFIVQIVIALIFSIVHTIYILKDISLF